MIAHAAFQTDYAFYASKSNDELFDILVESNHNVDIIGHILFLRGFCTKQDVEDYKEFINNTNFN